MQIASFITTKENSKEHSEEDINFFIQNLNSLTKEEITQWLKAVKKNGLNHKETTILTMAMANSGTVLSWNGLEPVIDKHSTGGIGDKITLLFAPLIAAYGVYIPKLSGRSLGISGGTIDKLESIPGFKTDLTIDEIKEQVKKIRLAVCSASKNLAPADKTLYAIRDVTDTVSSIPLIASSIMSKKIAGGAKNIVLDVKTGSGAFMKSLEDSKLLAQTMVSIGKNLNKNIKAVVTNMDQPLGYAIGNALEIKEVLEVLSGKEVQDLVEIVITLACESITLINPNAELNLEKKLTDLLLKGNALKKFNEMILAQGGNLQQMFKEDNKAKYIEVMKSTFDGCIHSIDALLVGEVVHSLGAGRKLITDKIDHSVGIVLYKKAGDNVSKGESILEIYAKDNNSCKDAKAKLQNAVKITQSKPIKQKLIHEIVK